MTTSASEVLAVRRGWLVAALLAACLMPLFALLRALYLSVYLEPTAHALYAARVGSGLRAPAAGALVVLVAVAVALKWASPWPAPALTVGVMATITALLGLTGVALVTADHSMHPFGPELRAVAAFVPPPGSAHTSDLREASDAPEVTRYWHVAASAQSVCGPALASFRAWADRDTVSDLLPGPPADCYFRGRRGEDVAELTVVDPSTGPAGTALLGIHAQRSP